MVAVTIVQCLLGGAASLANEQMKQHHVAEHLEKGKEIGKEYTAKSWNFMKGMYANVAGQVETVARDNGYKVDLGEHALLRILSLHVVLYVNSTTGVKAITQMHTGSDRPMFSAGASTIQLQIGI